MRLAPLALVGWALLLLAVPGAHGAVTPAVAGPISITPISPGPNTTVYTAQPVIQATFTDNGSAIDKTSVLLYVDGLNVTGVENVTITASSVTYPVSSLLKLKAGNASVTVDVSDLDHHTASYSWNFTVNLTASLSSPIFTLPAHTLVLYLGLGGLVAGVGTGSYILYLKRTRRFTFARYFATHPVQSRYFVVYLPAVAAFLFLISGLDFVYNTPRLPSRSPDYVVVIAIFIGLTPLAVDARRSMQRLRAFERAFAQFLFESADAIRGGLDPAKAVVELSKTHTDILQKPLRGAADGIRVGRPFDQVIRELAAPMKSKLISRYAGLIADAATIGGETSIVVHRAAKDMDDFIKIEVERSNLLTLPVAVVYIAFGVLMAVLFALLSIAPSIGTINISLLGGNVLSGASSAALPRLSSSLLGERFFELMLINSLGTGAIIGAFTEGKARFGLVHSLALVAATTVAFALLFP